MKRFLICILAVLLLSGCSAVPDMSVDTEPVSQTLEEQTTPEEQTMPAEPSISEEQTVSVEETVLDTPFSLTVNEVLFTTHGQQQKICDDQMITADIAWSSTDEAIATVADGVVTAVGRGEVTITATYQEETHSCHVVCDLPVLPVVDENAAPEDPVYLPPGVEIVDDAFFDDALFISDSQGWALYKCAEYDGLLGESMHMTRNSYSVDSAANDRMLLSWAGQSFVIERAIERTGAKRVFIMLGVNDVGHYKLEELHLIMDNWKTIVDRIRAVTPDIQICLESIAPVWVEGQTKDITNEKVSAYNELLRAFANENDCVFIDVATYLMDGNGGLATVYCADKFVHLNAAGVDTWIKVLKACTDYE